MTIRVLPRLTAAGTCSRCGAVPDERTGDCPCSSLDARLAATPPAPESAVTVTPPRERCRRHTWHIEQQTRHTYCSICGVHKDPVRSRRGRQSRNYGNRAELDVARRYGGTKVGHHGGPVDVRGTDWHTQVKTHRRKPPAEWTKAFAGMAASTDRLPRLLLRFVLGPGQPPQDFVVVPGSAWLDWFGKDGETR